jgi:hypothetical protein
MTMTPDTFRRSPETIPGRRLRLEKIHPRHAPAFHASVQRSMVDLDFIAWGAPPLECRGRARTL